MNDPRRLIDVERGRALELLRAARDVAPAPPGAVEQTLQGLATAASAGSVSLVATLKWMALGMTVGVGVSGLVAVTTRGEPAAVSSSSPARTASFVASARAAPQPQVVESVAPPAPSPRTSTVVRQRSPSLSAPSTALAAEVAELERARTLLSQGDSDRTLGVLDEYASRFAQPQLAPEAALLRIRALSAGGRVEAARELARRLLMGNPSPEYATQVRKAAGVEVP